MTTRLRDGWSSKSRSGRRAIRGSKPRATCPRVGAFLLALYCALWIAILPLLPQLHQAFANHRHVYCLDHHQIEDAGPKGQNAETVKVKRGAGDKLLALQGSVSDIDSRPACLFSSVAIQFSLIDPPMASSDMAVIEGEGALAAVHSVDVVPCEIILLAPKQSPPETSA